MSSFGDLDISELNNWVESLQKNASTSTNNDRPQFVNIVRMHEKVKAIINIIKERNIISWADLVDFCIENNYNGYLEVLCGPEGFLIIEYLKSRTAAE